MVVDNSGHVKRFERLTPLTYDNGSLFNHSTTIESFKAELSTTTRADPYICGETGAMRNSEYPRRFPTISSNFQASDPYAATLLPSSEDAQRRFQGFTLGLPR